MLSEIIPHDPCIMKNARENKLGYIMNNWEAADHQFAYLRNTEVNCNELKKLLEVPDIEDK